MRNLTHYLRQFFLLDFIPEFLDFGISEPLIPVEIRIRNLPIYSNIIRDDLHQEVGLLEGELHLNNK